jgi:hypothetical protein
MSQTSPWQCLVRAIALALVCVTLAASSALAEEFRWDDRPEEGICDLWYGDAPALRYVYTVDESTPEMAFDTAKVFHHVYGPGTDTLITKGPGGSFPHHRGLYVGWNKTSWDGGGCDFWHCQKGERQRHIEFAELSTDGPYATMTAVIHWLAPDGQLVIEERRTLVVAPHMTAPMVTPGWQMDWSSTLTSHVGEVTLAGDRQHAGFQYRAAQEVADASSARYVRPDGFPQEPEAHEVSDDKDGDAHSDLGWLLMTYPLAGEHYNVEYFEAPGQPTPSRFSERPYGRFGAYYTAKVTAESPLAMRYRLLISTGTPPANTDVQPRYDEFVAEVAEATASAGNE